MFCSGCGSQIQTGLNYCSRCGRRVQEVEKPASSPLSRSLTVAGQTAGVGFVGYIFILLILVLNGVVGDVVFGVTFFYFLFLFLLCFMFLRQGRLVAKYEPTREPAGDPLYVKAVATAQLPEPTERPASVTEHTTRTLDHVVVDRT